MDTFLGKLTRPTPGAVIKARGLQYFDHGGKGSPHKGVGFFYSSHHAGTYLSLLILLYIWNG
jgi:hypothetical protein